MSGTVDSIAVNNYSFTESRKQVELLAIFDSRVENLALLERALLPGAISYTINEYEDAIVRILGLLAETKAKKLAIFAHGEPGIVYIGREPLTRQILMAKAALFEEWNVEEIALYSCEVGGDRQFVEELKKVTGAKIFAASKKLGALVEGGNWELDVKEGESRVNFPILVDRLAEFTEVLATFNATTNVDNILGTGSADTINVTNPNQINSGDNFDGAGGNDILAIGNNAGTFDFSGIVISNVESLTAGTGTQTVTLTHTQFDNFTSINLGGGTDTLNVQINGSLDLSLLTFATTTNIENKKLLGFNSDDSVIITQSQYGVFTAIDLDNGTDSLTIKTSSNFNFSNPITLTGIENIIIENSSANNTLTGSSNSETINANDGNDTVIGNDGNDSLND